MDAQDIDDIKLDSMMRRVSKRARTRRTTATKSTRPAASARVRPPVGRERPWIRYSVEGEHGDEDRQGPRSTQRVPGREPDSNLRR